jgi:hypothetical protein
MACSSASASVFDDTNVTGMPRSASTWPSASAVFGPPENFDLSNEGMTMLKRRGTDPSRTTSKGIGTTPAGMTTLRNAPSERESVIGKVTSRKRSFT